MDIMNINGISNQAIMYSHGIQWVIMDVNTIWNMNGCVSKQEIDPTLVMAILTGGKISF